MYYKLYRSLEFDVIRSKQQCIRWNRITNDKLGSATENGEYYVQLTKNIPVNGRCIKVIGHVPEKFRPPQTFPFYRRWNKRVKTREDVATANVAKNFAKESKSPVTPQWIPPLNFFMMKDLIVIIRTENTPLFTGARVRRDMLKIPLKNWTT